MSEAPIGYTVEFDVHDGQADAFEQTAEEMSQRVEKTEPGTTLYQLFVSPDGESARTCEWFASQEDAVAHITGETVQTLLPQLLEAGEITSVEVYGTPTGKLAEVVDDFPVSGTFERVGGFTR